MSVSRSSLYDYYDHALAQEPLPRGHEFIILVDCSLVIITTCTYYDPCSGLAKNLKEIHKFYPFNTKLCPFEMGVMKFTILYFFSLHVLHTKFGKY